MASFSVRPVLGISPLHPKTPRWAAGLSAVAMLSIFGMVLAVASPPENRSPSQPAAGAVAGVASKSGAAVARPLTASAMYHAAANATGKNFVIESKFLLDDGSTLMAPRVSVREGESAFVQNGSESPFVTRLTKTPDGKAQPNIEYLHEGVSINLKAVGDTDGLINVDATVEVADIASVGTKTVANSTRQSPRRKSQSIRAIESVAIGEKLVIPLENPRPKQPPVTTLQALSNVVLGKRPPAAPPKTTGLEITVREMKIVAHDSADGPQPQPPVAAPRDPERTAAVPNHLRRAAVRPESNRSEPAQGMPALKSSPAPAKVP